MKSNRTEILVWGTGINAIRFMSEHKEENIKGFIENNTNKIVFANKPVFDANSSVIRNNYIVIATSEPVFWIIKKQLDELGFEEFEDYCYYSIYKKKVAVVYGNCHTIPTKEGLLLSKEFRNIYGFYPIRPIYEIKNNNYLDLESSIFSKADLFIHQCIARNNYYGEYFSSERLIEKVPKDCIVIGMPALYKMPKCFYPQIDTSLRGVVSDDYSYYPNRDLYIENTSINEKNVEIIAKNIINEDIFKKNEIKYLFNVFIEKVKDKEKNWDIKMAEWILDNYQEHQLFYDVNHPTNYTISRFINEILKRLKINNNIENFDYIYRMDNSEDPVYGQVRRELGLKWTNINCMRKYSKHSLSGIQIDIDEYVREYIAWYSCGVVDD